MAWYYAEHVDADWWNHAESRDDAISGGADLVKPGAKYWIGEGDGHAPFSTLFHDIKDLREFIDDRNEELVYEDAFTAEANLGDDDLQPLFDALTKAWTDFIALHKPTSNQIDFASQEEITRPAEAPAGAAIVKESAQ